MSTSVLVSGTLHQRHSRVPTNDATSSHRLHSIERVGTGKSLITSILSNQTEQHLQIRLLTQSQDITENIGF